MAQKWFYIFWLTPKALLMVVIAALIIRKLWREFPFFLSYSIVQILETSFILMFKSHISYSKFFYTVWTIEAVGVLAIFLVINEIFKYALKPYSALKQLSKVLFQWAFIVILLVAVVTAVYAPGNDSSRLIAGIVTLKRTMSIIEVGLLAFLCLFIRAFAIPWRHYLFGLTFGFMVYRAAELSMLAARAHWGGSIDQVMNWVLVLANNCTVMMWVSYFVIPQGKQTTLRYPTGNQLQQWNDALREAWQ